uniref:Uncharacterized protein n=1 Tax=Siphoviridae sp. ct8hR1 TaxID=2826172 RepID=A0A8S5N9T4_9CAUD|nr:MAG TPA: hypothetical protein [Siphoviridae sp. ct8hR1]DAI93240.1 MAG TPA: hypothetical protein [Caudoviricetes sp.]DAZ75582.1 MAG TPA: hypothetical protein [Caudoviricetes sp.]
MQYKQIFFILRVAKSMQPLYIAHFACQKPVQISPHRLSHSNKLQFL